MTIRLTFVEGTPADRCARTTSEERTMTTVDEQAARTVAPSPVEVIRAAEGLHELVDAHGAENDRTGRIAEPVVEALYAAGAIGGFTPRELGGSEMTPRQLMDLYRALSHADPSAGWVTMALSMVTGLAGAFFDEDTAA